MPDSFRLQGNTHTLRADKRDRYLVSVGHGELIVSFADDSKAKTVKAGDNVVIDKGVTLASADGAHVIVEHLDAEATAPAQSSGSGQPDPEVQDKGKTNAGSTSKSSKK